MLKIHSLKKYKVSTLTQPQRKDLRAILRGIKVRTKWSKRRLLK
jgi:hypothetical protein